MAVRNIRTGDDPILRKRARQVDKIDEKILENLQDMMDTLHATDNGAALAANQVGILKKLVVIDYLDYKWKLINPVISKCSGEQECIEGCLSFPEYLAQTVRPQEVTVHALNEKGEEVIVHGEGELAKCLCHEIEHLEGIVFIDHAKEIMRVKPYLDEEME